MTVRFKAWVCSRSLAGANRAGRRDVCVLPRTGLWGRPITRLEESYRLWCVVVWFRNFNNESSLVHWGLLCHIYIYIYCDSQQIYCVCDGGLLTTKPIRAHFCIRITTWGEITASESLVLMYQSRLRYIPEDGIFSLQHFVTLDCTATRSWIWKILRTT